MNAYVQAARLLNFGMMLLVIELGRSSVVYAQPPDCDESTKELSTTTVDPTALDGEWWELSFEIGGKPGIEFERDPRTETFVPVDSLWRLSSQSEPSFTRRVLRGDTENNDGDFYLGKHILDTTESPHRIIFLGSSIVDKPSRPKIVGIFKVHEDLLVIALPKWEYNAKTKTYDVSRLPIEFDSREDSTGITVYTLRRRPLK